MLRAPSAVGCTGVPIEMPPWGCDTETCGGCSEATPFARPALVGDDGALCCGVAVEDAGLLPLCGFSGVATLDALCVSPAVEMADAS